MTRVIVVGAGVVGLTCAVRLAEAGHRVDVLARDLPLETTSVVAAALWYPYRAWPEEKVTAWGRTAYDAFAELAAAEPAAGVRMLAGTEVLARRTPDPGWAATVRGLARTPVEGYADAWTFTAPVVDMPVHLRWLADRLAALGGTLTRMSLRALPAPADGEEVVVNCSGIGARLLAHDDRVVPVRGQVVLVAGVEVDRWWLDESGPTYVVPRGDTVVVGGTAEEGEWSRTPDPATARSVLRRATTLVPALERARVVAHRVGLRPVRPEVRVATEGRTVHCYGHGGAGVTLGWGTAQEVVERVAQLAGT